MWVIFWILFVALLLTQVIVNILKILNHIEITKTAKQTAEMLDDHFKQIVNNCKCDGKHFKEED